MNYDDSVSKCSLILAKFSFFPTIIITLDIHCTKNVQTRSFFWSVFSRFWTKYRDLRRKTLYLDTLYAVINITYFANTKISPHKNYYDSSSTKTNQREIWQNLHPRKLTSWKLISAKTNVLNVVALLRNIVSALCFIIDIACRCRVHELIKATDLTMWLQ